MKMNVRRVHAKTEGPVWTRREASDVFVVRGLMAIFVNKVLCENDSNRLTLILV